MADWWDFEPDYGFSGGTSQGLQMPSDYSYGGGYELYGGDTSQGLQMPDNYSYGGGYELYGGSTGYGSGSAGLKLPSYGATAPAADLYRPSSSFVSPTVTAGAGTDYSFAPSGTPMGLVPGGGATFRPGQGATVAPTSISPATPQAGLTGSAGYQVAEMGSPEWSQSVNELANTRMARQGTGAVEDTGEVGLIERAGDRLAQLEAWAKANPKVASALTQGVGALAQYAGRRKASKAMEQQAAQQAKQSQVADYWNQQSVQSGNEARSLYNPQEMATRGMAREVAATGRREQEAYAAAIRRGMTPAEAQAEARRVRLAGSTAATTGYMTGFDVGRKAQEGALSSAKGLSMSYGAPNTTMADQYTAAANMTGDQVRKLLEFYTGEPTRAILRQREEAETRSTAT